MEKALNELAKSDRIPFHSAGTTKLSASRSIVTRIGAGALAWSTIPSSETKALSTSFTTI